MKWIFILVVTVTVTCCHSSAKKEPGSTTNDTAQAGSDQPVVSLKIEAVKGSAADIPATMRLKGTLQEVWKWKDKLGENLLITTAVAPYKDKQVVEMYGEEGLTAELYAFHYVKKEDGQYSQVWLLTDAEKGCPFDLTCGFLKDAVTITDLDADEIAETTVQYKLTCRSDVSPAYMKLIMHEGETKYALRGMMWYGAPDEKFEVTEGTANLETLPGYKKEEGDFYKTWGRYESEKEFAGAPPEFIVYARSRWMKFAKENIE
jgi:hypothetical protein